MLAIQSPYPFFLGLDGLPLRGGKVYFGQPNQDPLTAPIDVTWDDEGTIPAGQPVRTTNGYMMRLGTPANVFCATDYSIAAYDSTGQRVFWEPTASAINQALQLAGPDGADQVGTEAPEDGGIPETVNVWIQRERVFPEQFGAYADGNSYVLQLQKAINAASTRGMPLNLRGRTYRADAASGGLLLPVAGLEVENGSIDLSHVAGNIYPIQAASALGASVAVTSPVSLYATTLQLATTAGRAVGDWLILTSSDFWAKDDSVLVGEWVRIRSVDSGVQVTLTQPVRSAYTTSPIVYAPTAVDHFISTDFHLIGGGVSLNQNAIMLQYVRDVRVYGSDARKFAARGFAYDTCQNIEIECGRPGEGDDTTGLSYGHVISGPTIRATARSITGDALRHVITAGGTTGVVENYSTTDIVGLGCTDATVDAHPAVRNFRCVGTRHTGDNTAGGADGDGIVSQALHTHIDDFVITRAARHALLIQPFCSTELATAFLGKGKVREHGTYTSSSCWAVDVDALGTYTAGIDRVVIDDIDIESTQTNANGFLINVDTTVLNSGRLTGSRVKTPGRAIDLDAHTAAGKKILDFQVLGGHYETTVTTTECVLAQGNSAGDVDFLRLNEMHTVGGSNGIRGINCTNYRVSDNDIKGYAGWPGSTANATLGFAHNGTTQYFERNNIT